MPSFEFYKGSVLKCPFEHDCVFCKKTETLLLSYNNKYSESDYTEISYKEKIYLLGQIAFILLSNK